MKQKKEFVYCRYADCWLRIHQLYWKTPMGLQSKADCDKFFKKKNDEIQLLRSKK